MYSTKVWQEHTSNNPKQTPTPTNSIMGNVIMPRDLEPWSLLISPHEVWGANTRCNRAKVYTTCTHARSHHHHRTADPSLGKRSTLSLPGRPAIDAATVPNSATVLSPSIQTHYSPRLCHTMPLRAAVTDRVHGMPLHPLMTSASICSKMMTSCGRRHQKRYHSLIWETEINISPRNSPSE